MDILKTLVEHIWDELEGAQKYCSCAMRNKNKFPDLAMAFRRMAAQELSHAETLHEHAAQIVKAHAPTTPGMDAVWAWESDKYRLKMAHVKMEMEVCSKDD
jgi:ferritin